MESRHLGSITYDLGSFDDSLRQHCLSRGWNRVNLSTLFGCCFWNLPFDVNVLIQVSRRKPTTSCEDQLDQTQWLVWEAPSCWNSVAAHLWCEPRTAGWVAVEVSWSFGSVRRTSSQVSVSSILHRVSIASEISQDQMLTLKAESTSRPATLWSNLSPLLLFRHSTKLAKPKEESRAIT